MHSVPTQRELRLVTTPTTDPAVGPPYRPDSEPSEADTVGTRPPDRPGPTPYVSDPASPVPLARLRTGNREPIPPEKCLVPRCLVCAWRRAGLIPDLPSNRL